MAAHEKLGAERNEYERAKIQLGEREAALEQLERTIRLAPDETDFYRSQAALLGQLGRESEAAAAYREALRMRRGKTPATWL